MTAAIWVLSILLIAEFVMAPVNLMSGRTMGNFTRFTGWSPAVARRLFAPAKALAAVLIAIGLGIFEAGVVGAALAVAICSLYLFRLASPVRRDAAGVIGFAVFGSWAIALLALQIAR